MNVPNYDILQNTRYADKFQYTQIDRRFENISTNIVDNMIYLGEDRVRCREDGFPRRKSSKMKKEEDLKILKSQIKQQAM